MINIRQQKYKKNRLLGMNGYNAARAAGYSENTAVKHVKRLEESVKIADVLDRKGLTDEVLVSKHKELLDAQKVIFVDGKPLKGEQGGITIPEYFIQTKALELAYKLKDHIRDKADKGVSVVVNVMTKVEKEGKPLEYEIGEPLRA